jgi:hypothetical protein
MILTLLPLLVALWLSADALRRLARRAGRGVGLAATRFLVFWAMLLAHLADTEDSVHWHDVHGTEPL